MDMCIFSRLKNILIYTNAVFKSENFINSKIKEYNIKQDFLGGAC